MTRVHLHIGAPKTGTTYLQEVLFRNRSRLRVAGLLYPGDTADAHFRATLDLRGMRFGGHDDPGVEGAWRHLVGRIRDWHGDTAVVSHELLAGSSEEAVARLRADLAGAEVHVVLTTRDLGRQVPAVWQEMVKNGQTLSYARYLEQVTGARKGRGARVFWRQQDAVDVLARWGEQVPAERIHVVTVPAPGARSSLLWERFCTVVGVDPGGYDAEVRRTNVSLGLAEAELVRRVNEVLDDRLDWPDFAALVKDGLAERLLARRVDTARARVPDELRGWFDEAAGQLIDGLAGRGYDVVGDLEDLRPRYGDEGARAAPPADDVLDAAAYVLAEQVAERAGKRRRGAGRLAAELSLRLRGRWRRRVRRVLPVRPLR